MKFYFRILVGLVLLALLGGGGWYALSRTKHGKGVQAAPPEPAKPAAETVEVVRPLAGGITRLCVQPGSVEPFESADLYAKVSGYLAEQSVAAGGVKRAVDIGTRVKAGDVLARLSVPEYEKQVERDQARVRDADAKVRQMEAHLRAAQAEARAAAASVALARVMVKAKTSYRSYRQKQLERITALAEAKAVDAKLKDEQEDFYQSALEAENAAKEQVNTAQEKASAAEAQVAQAEADVDEAKAAVGVAEAEAAKSKALLDYTTITAPYTGVVTKRNFHVGDFIKSADQGGTVPLLAVERTDLMRVVVQVPDRDVPYVSTESTAVVEIDALPGVSLGAGPDKLRVARWADAEDPTTRTMRTEVDVPNPDGRLRHGMYGRTTLTLTGGTPNALRVPSAALVGKAQSGRGAVRVVRGGTAHLVPVRYATDNGVEVEIVAGLNPSDLVIARATGPVEEGTPVTAHEEPPAAPH